MNLLIPSRTVNYALDFKKALVSVIFGEPHECRNATVFQPIKWHLFDVHLVLIVIHYFETVEARVFVAIVRPRMASSTGLCCLG